MNDINSPLVIVRSLVYNHEPYLRQCLDGFVMQKTNFIFEVQIHDDASTDNSAAIILEYAEKYPDIIKPYIEEENQYSKGSKGKWKWGPLNCKYVALCEGDDYWTDPLKLQKQINFLESHPEYTMTCNRVKLYSEKKKKFVGEDYCYTKDTTINVKDVIYKTGLFISTCSIVYRKTIIENYPDYCRKCSVGDYPLQIMAAMKGKIFYMNSIMSVYRIENSNSWMGNQKWLSADDSRLRVIHSRVNMLKGFSLDYPQYTKYFKNKIADEISRNMPYSMWDYEGMKKYIKSFEKEISKFSLLWRIDFILRTTRLPLINRYYYKSQYLFKHFQHDRQYY